MITCHPRGSVILPLLLGHRADDIGTGTYVFSGDYCPGWRFRGSQSGGVGEGTACNRTLLRGLETSARFGGDMNGVDEHAAIVAPPER
jgi:hypothetical protein